jgi:PncC family amidohydrolase
VGLLREARALLVCAESCTGGLIAERITRIPGCSDVFWGSVVVYDNRAKRRILRVPAGTLRQHGAVSRETACAMAEAAFRLAGGARSRALAVATTGIAGPGGGSKQKPVGLCFIAIASARSRGRARVVRVPPEPGGRARQKRRFAERALREALKEARRA